MRVPNMKSLINHNHWLIAMTMLCIFTTGSHAETEAADTAPGDVGRADQAGNPKCLEQLLQPQGVLATVQHLEVAEKPCRIRGSVEGHAPGVWQHGAVDRQRSRIPRDQARGDRLLASAEDVRGQADA